MKITKKSKCIYRINEVEVDIRKKFRGSNWIKYDGVRQALMLYFTRENMNMGMNYVQIDRRVCQLMNQKDWGFWNAFENGTITI